MRLTSFQWFSRLAAAGLLAASFCAAEVKVPALFSDHMVLQRDYPIHVWGTATKGESVSVTFGDATRATQADDAGRWSVYLPAVAAGGPFTLTVKGQNTIRLSDVLVGDVWVASGQSNMEFRLRNADRASEEAAAANYPRIRRFFVTKNVSNFPLRDVTAEPWTPCTPEVAAKFSAVAYFFARDLQEKVHVPIGIIESFWGGSFAESWTSARALGQDGTLAASAFNMVQQFGASNPGDPFQFAPSVLYNAMIAPLTPYPIKGVIWYQGESNSFADRAPLYGRLFQTMITDWRRAWGVGNFPFLYVQIANYGEWPNGDWSEVRDCQRRTLALENTGMAVTIDIGMSKNIHPTNKQDVGKRLALAARAIAYAEKIEYSGPLFRNAVPDGKQLTVWFDHAASGLVAKGGALKGFEVAGADRKFAPAEARIEGAKVILTSGTVAAPVYARYAWSNDPECNLYNNDGLPASPFRSTE